MPEIQNNDFTIKFDQEFYAPEDLARILKVSKSYLNKFNLTPIFTIVKIKMIHNSKKSKTRNSLPLQQDIKWEKFNQINLIETFLQNYKKFSNILPSLLMS
jgi:hypothetical protein